MNLPEHDGSDIQCQQAVTCVIIWTRRVAPLRQELHDCNAKLLPTVQFLFRIGESACGITEPGRQPSPRRRPTTRRPLDRMLCTCRITDARHLALDELHQLRLERLGGCLAMHV